MQNIFGCLLNRLMLCRTMILSTTPDLQDALKNERI
nr:MAG TPA: hypothetical protein [Caudoviricetes sp.]